MLQVLQSHSGFLYSLYSSFGILCVFWYFMCVLILYVCFDIICVFWYFMCVLVFYVCFGILCVFWYLMCVLVSYVCLMYFFVLQAPSISIVGANLWKMRIGYLYAEGGRGCRGWCVQFWIFQWRYSSLFQTGMMAILCYLLWNWFTLVIFQLYFLYK